MIISSSHLQLSSCLWLVLLLLSLSSSPVYADSNWQLERELYKAARKALSNKNIDKFDQYTSRLTDYPLYPYLVYDALKRRLSSLSDHDVDAFLAAYQDGPLAKRLRVAWLHQLQKKDHPERFLKYYRDDQAVTLQCYFLHSKIRLGQFQENEQAYLNQIRDLWLVGNSQPQQCDPLFNWFSRQGYLNKEIVWQRFALAMTENRTQLANYLAKKLPVSEHQQARLWLEVHRDPKTKLLSDALQKDEYINRKIITHGIKRLAQKDLVNAHKMWSQMKDYYAFGSDLHDEIEQSLALRAAYRHDEHATTWMYQLPKEVLAPATAMWRVRSAIRNLDWDLVLLGVTMLSDTEKQKLQWQYWKARALAEKGLHADAAIIYKSIAPERDYYGFLASDALAITYNIVDTPVRYDDAELEKIESTASVVRARELLFVKQFPDARREWNYAIQNFSAKQYQSASLLAHQWNWHDYAIRTIAKGRYFDDLSIRFPMPFAREIEKYAAQRRLDPAFVYGVMRRESAFSPLAHSSAGARGLMQLMPATAKQVSKQLKLKSFRQQNLYIPDFNINLGSQYLADMLNQYGNHRVLASAAYNAGPHRVKTWLPKNDVLPADVWVDTIPFSETRKYVRAVLTYTAIFEWKRAQKPTRLSVHLQPIVPKPKNVHPPNG